MALPKPLKAIASPVPIPCAAVEIPVPKAVRTDGTPLNAVLIPVPIPLALVAIPLPADSNNLPKPPNICDKVLLELLAFFVTSSKDSVAFFLNNLNGFNPLIKSIPLVANLIALSEPTIPNNE